MITVKSGPGIIAPEKPTIKAVVNIAGSSIVNHLLYFYGNILCAAGKFLPGPW
jgi:hypothetical protein